MSFVSVLIGMLLASPAADGVCLLAEASGKAPYLYRKRETRCEGVVPENYAVEPTIKLLAYFYADPVIAASGLAPNLIRIYGADARSLNKQIVVRGPGSSGRALNYMMDTNVNGLRYSWPSDVIGAKLGFSDGRNFVGYACSPGCGDSQVGRIYYPIAITPGETAVKPMRYLVFSIPVTLRDVSVAIEARGRSTLLRRERGPFSATYRLSVLVGTTVASGTYSLVVSGRSSSGGVQSFNASVMVP